MTLRVTFQPKKGVFLVSWKVGRQGVERICSSVVLCADCKEEILFWCVSHVPEGSQLPGLSTG